MGVRRLPALLLTGLLSLGLMPWGGAAALAHNGAHDGPGHDQLDDKGGTRPDGISDDSGSNGSLGDDKGGTRKAKDSNKGRSKNRNRNGNSKNSDDKGKRKGGDDKGSDDKGRSRTKGSNDGSSGRSNDDKGNKGDDRRR